MKLIGYWIRSVRNTDYLPPQEFVGGIPPATRDQVARYPDSGPEFAAYRGVSWCRFFCDHSMGHRELSDGRWIWPEGLSHYVRNHGVRLPYEFLKHAELNQMPIPKEEWDPGAPDEEFWKDWCRQNSAGKWEAKLEIAR